MRLLLEGAGTPAAAGVPLSEEAKEVFNHAWREAESLAHEKVRSDHLLLGLLASEKAVASILKESGLDAAAVRAAIPDRDPDADEQ
jgi:ATP-dependent Clp protease ATP-binding subunit ClpA